MLMSFYDFDLCYNETRNYLVVKQNITTLLNESITVISGTTRSISNTLDFKPTQTDTLLSEGFIDIDNYRYLITRL